MDTKHCPMCSQINILMAKFCMACKAEFPNIAINQKATVQPPPQAPQAVKLPASKNKKIQFVIDTDRVPQNETEIETEGVSEITYEDIEDLGTQLLKLTESAMGAKPKAVKFGDVVATEQSNAARTERKSVQMQAKTADEIRESTIYKGREGSR